MIVLVQLVRMVVKRRQAAAAQQSYFRCVLAARVRAPLAPAHRAAPRINEDHPRPGFAPQPVQGPPGAYPAQFGGDAYRAPMMAPPPGTYAQLPPPGER